MIRYNYKAKDVEGKLIRGSIEANSDSEFYKELDKKGLYCISVSTKDLEGNGRQYGQKRLKMKELSVFCREFSVLLASGMNLMTALQLLYERESKPRIKESYMQMIENIEKGDSLYEAMRRQGNTYPGLLKAMILAGETSGSIDMVMEKMAGYYEREAVMKSKVQNAMIYPVILIVVTLAVVLVLFTFVLPQFFNMFEGQSLPFITEVFMGISKFLTSSWYWLILAIAIVIVAYRSISKLEKVAYQLDKMKLSLPIFGKLIEKIVMAHFANAMNILYASGITIIKALEISSGTINNAYIAEKLVHVRERVEKGEALSTALQSEKMFDKMFWSMVHIGEESGNLETMFYKLSEYLEGESEAAVKKMMAVLEPLILIIIALVIGAVIISVLLPIYSMYQL